MMVGRRLMVLCVAAGLLAGCSAIDRLTGQTDNTVLPGSRQEAIPGRPSFPEKRDVAAAPAPNSATVNEPVAGPGETETYCGPDDPGCKPPATTGDTFKDPQ
jgi:hypothetical protein